MSQPATGAYINYSDVKQFTKQYLEERRLVLGLCVFLIFVGFVIYLQILSAQCSNVDPCGCVGSSAAASNGDADGNTMNGNATGCLVTLSLFVLIMGVAGLAYYMCLIKQSKKLTDAGFPACAELINGKKGVAPDAGVLAYQTEKTAEMAQRAGADIQVTSSDQDGGDAQ